MKINAGAFLVFHLIAALAGDSLIAKMGQTKSDIAWHTEVAVVGGIRMLGIHRIGYELSLNRQAH